TTRRRTSRQFAPMAERHTSTEQVELVQDPDERARREAENGIRQTELALEIIRAFIHDRERPFRLRQGILMQLHAKALEGIHLLAGTFRNGPAKIHGSNHEPPPAWAACLRHSCSRPPRKLSKLFND